jgi:hypothetical protein
MVVKFFDISGDFAGLSPGNNIEIGFFPICWIKRNPEKEQFCFRLPLTFSWCSSKGKILFPETSFEDILNFEIELRDEAELKCFGSVTGLDGETSGISIAGGSIFFVSVGKD